MILFFLVCWDGIEETVPKHQIKKSSTRGCNHMLEYEYLQRRTFFLPAVLIVCRLVARDGPCDVESEKHITQVYYNAAQHKKCPLYHI